MSDIVITLPKTIAWEDYQQELLAAESGDILNFKLSGRPDVVIGDKCYLVHNGAVRGYMLICGLSEGEFRCTTTGRWWPRGHYVQRTGRFHALEQSVSMKGFQGFRYWKG